jgi:hypothetical protein
MKLTAHLTVIAGVIFAVAATPAPVPAVGIAVESREIGLLPRAEAAGSFSDSCSNIKWSLPNLSASCGAGTTSISLDQCIANLGGFLRVRMPPLHICQAKLTVPLPISANPTASTRPRAAVARLTALFWSATAVPTESRRSMSVRNSSPLHQLYMTVADISSQTSAWPTVVAGSPARSSCSQSSETVGPATKQQRRSNDFNSHTTYFI